MIEIKCLKLLFVSILTLLIFSITSPALKAQIFDNDQNPPGLKWMQLNTPNFQIIYPSELRDDASRIANTVEKLISGVSESLGKQPRKITIILQNQGVISNGFVQLAPRRSEFFTTAPQSFDVQDWLNSLAVHELRHVAQFDKLTGNLQKPFFEELALAMFGITLPAWFFEGDAVGTETALTHAGRGRLPEWEMIFRTNTLSKLNYSYSKDFFGSLKDQTPGYYQLGYFMTTKLKRDHGIGIIDSILTRLRKNPLLPYSLSQSVKKFTGMNTRMLHDSTVRELRGLWEVQQNSVSSENYTALNRREKDLPVDYLFPVRAKNGEIITLRKGFDKTPAITRIDQNGSEHELIKIGFQTESNLNYSGDKLVWDEFRYDKRFQKRSFNVINIYDLDKGSYRQLTKKSRYFAPSLSPDLRSIAVIEISLANKVGLREIDSETGAVVRSYPNPSNLMLQTPSYSADGKKIVCVAIGVDGAALIEFDRTSGSGTLVSTFQIQQISRPVYAGDRILFRAHYNGINNIYSTKRGEQPQQHTFHGFGAGNPSYNPADGTVLFNIFHPKGYDIASQKFSETKNLTPGRVANTFIDYARPLIAQEADSTLLDNIPRIRYPEKPYKELGNLFYFHSLSPIVEENEFNSDLNLGLKMKSNNQLNTLDFYAGYQFNYALQKSEYLAGFSYKRFYPVIGMNYVNRARLAYASSTQGGVTTLIPVNWRENFTELEVRVPFVANRLNKTYTMGITGSSSYTNRYSVINRPQNFNSRISFPLQYQFYFSRNSQRSARDLAPRWGQNLTFSYQSLPFDSNLSGDILRLQSSLFAPGLLTNHSFQASFNYQKTSGVYRFNIDIPRVSGYSNLTPTTLRNTLLFDYRLPLFYPDAQLGSLAYIKRIRAGVFADFQNVGKGNPFNPRTYGLELNADLNLLRFYLPDFDASGKIIFVNESGSRSPIFEFGLNYNL